MIASSHRAIAALLAVCTLPAFASTGSPEQEARGAGIANVTLEMSLKPFRVMDEEFIAAISGEMFRQWWPLTRHADRISVLLWIGDGSEILTYQGSLDQEIEWAKYIGGANAEPKPGADLDKLSLHQRHFLYTENPPVVTYGRLKQIVGILKRVGAEVTGKPIRVGATFDPGPEFAKSPFKYDKHREICLGNTMGKATFVCCYSTLNQDEGPYAGFPNGIPQGTRFGVFFGRQCQHFLSDLAFDYIWLSNGFGFGVEAWGVTGAVFDGSDFDTGKIAGVRDKILGFWRDLRAECPEFPIETRGTNLSTGMDLASDGVPLRAIYAGGFNLMPPPNSPWAALNGDFGLELVGYMSHIAEIPGEHFPFRYYVHDPWWLNSPWLDRYGREPHDIYLPASVSRIDVRGRVCRASWIEFLTVDNSYGEMPVACPNEVIPHILRARADAPDQPGPLVWVYPFDAYHEMTFGAQPRVDEVLFGDWFMRLALNDGLPLNTVVSTANFLASREAVPKLYAESVLVAPVPDSGSPLEAALIEIAKAGGKVLLYGPLHAAGEPLLDGLNLALAEPLSGELELDLRSSIDLLSETPYPTRVNHRPLTCAGGIRAVLKDDGDASTRVGATVANGADLRAIAVARQHPEWEGGAVAWVRGTNPNYYRKGAHLLATDDANAWFSGDLLMRFMLSSLGYDFVVSKRTPGQRNPVVCVARSNNGFFFSGYNPNTTVALHLRFPQGAPLLIGFDTALVDGRATYTMPRAWHRECRVFVDQQADGEVSCTEQPSVEYGVTRRLKVSGLKDATVRFYPESPPPRDRVKILANAHYPYTQGAIEYTEAHDGLGRHVVVHNVSGHLVIAW